MGSKYASEENALAEKFDDHYVNIAEKSCIVKSESFASLSIVTDDQNVIEIIQHYNDYLSIIKIIENRSSNQLSEAFKFKQVNGSHIYKFSKTHMAKNLLLFFANLYLILLTHFRSMFPFYTP